MILCKKAKWASAKKWPQTVFAMKKTREVSIYTQNKTRVVARAGRAIFANSPGKVWLDLL